MTIRRDDHLWAVVLAAGEGTRLASLTRALYGYDLPKQFATLAGERSLLQATLERIAPLVAARRTLVVASAQHAELARRQLAAYPGVELILQPRNLDTGPGLLLPLTHIAARDADARVLVFPSDHHIAREIPFLEAAEAAVGLARRASTRIALIGAEPERADPDYGWIVPGRRIGGYVHRGVRAVSRFLEKPEEGLAERLFATGALWNTFVLAGPIGAFQGLADRYLPAHAAWFAAFARSLGSADAGTVLDGMYGVMPPASFSRAVLERAPNLAVVTMSDAGWSDWGSPRRVFQSLTGSPELARLIGRIAGLPAKEQAPATAHTAVA